MHLQQYNSDKYYIQKEFALQQGVTTMTVQRWIKNGTISGIKHGKYFLIKKDIQFIHPIEIYNQQFVENRHKIANMRKSNPCATLQQIGNEHHLSRERIRKILSREKCRTKHMPMHERPQMCQFCNNIFYRNRRQNFCSLSCANFVNQNPDVKNALIVNRLSANN